MRFSLLACLWLIDLSFAMANELDSLSTLPVYYEDAPDSQTRFFYDDHYFLADKYCQFKAIERVARYDFTKREFIGAFADFNNAGRLILRGNYQDGKKEGIFTAYHPNGQLKWEGRFIQDVPDGLWKYYYPDGKPLLEVEYSYEGGKIQNFWNRKGQQRVINGNGKYEFAVETDGYNEFGYIRYNRKGKVVDGLPHGNWIIEYIFDDGKKAGAGHELYEHGRFIQGYEAYKDEEFFGYPRYRLLPVDFSARAEALVGKECSIDEYSGFTGYLNEHFEAWFKEGLTELPDPQAIKFTVSVTKMGEPMGIEIDSTFSDRRYADLLLTGIRWIPYWLPSFANGEYINDTLTVTMEAFPDATEHKLRFFDVKIQRENGF